MLIDLIMAKVKVLKSDARQRLGRLNDALTDLLVDNTFNKHGINITDLYDVTAALHSCLTLIWCKDGNSLLKDVERI